MNTAKVPQERVLQERTSSGTQRPPRILFVVNVSWFFISHRLPIAVAAQKSGYEVHLAAHVTSEVDAFTLAEHGIRVHPLPLDRKAMGIASEVRLLSALLQLYRSLRPDLVHHVTIKPVLYGTLAARCLGIAHIINAVSGMGFLYTARSRTAAWGRWLVNRLYAQLLSGSHIRVILQNADDHDFFARTLGIAPRQLKLIRGSGVDLERFRFEPWPGDVPLIVLPGRMLRDKGVMEFVAAARRLRERGVAARCALVGPIDLDNRAGLDEATLRSCTADGTVEWWGERNDMPAVFARSHIVCLPSYREGLPKALIEAAAAGRAIVTTDVPGCREVVRHGWNGLLVPVRDSDALADALARLVADKPLREEMGRHGRELAEHEFALAAVVQATLDVYAELRP